MEKTIKQLIEQMESLGFSMRYIYQALNLPSIHSVTLFRRGTQRDKDVQAATEYINRHNIKTVFDVDACQWASPVSLRYDLDTAIIDLLHKGWTVGNIASLIGVTSKKLYRELYEQYTIKSEREQSDWYYLLTFGDKEPIDLMTLESTPAYTPAEEIIAKIHAKWSPYR